MANALHSAQTVADGIHILHAFEYADTASRTGAAGLLSTDVGKAAKQTDNSTWWLLTNHSPVTWVQIGGPTLGEANTASNQGAGGVGLFDNKNGTDLEFRNINAGSNKVSVTLDAPNKEVDLDLNEGNIVHQNLSGAGVNTHAQIDSHIADLANPHSVTATQIGLGNVTNDAQLKRSANDFNTFAEKMTLTSADRLLVEDSTAAGVKKWVQVANLPSTVGPDLADLISDHFMPNNLDLDEMGKYGWRQNKNGTQADILFVGIPGHPGVVRLEAGTASTGRSAIFLGQTTIKGFRIGGTNQIEFEAVIRMEGSVAAADLEYIQLGVGDDDWVNPGLLNDAVIVRGVGGGTFQVMASTGGSATVVNGTTTIVIGTWYRVGFIVTNPGGSPSVQLYVNGIAEGSPLTTNIPTTVDLLPGVKIDSNGGGVSPAIEIDRYCLRQLGDEED